MFVQLTQIVVPTFREAVVKEDTLAVDVTVRPLVRWRSLGDVDVDVLDHIDAHLLDDPVTLDVLALIGEDDMCRWGMRKWDMTKSPVPGCFGLTGPTVLKPHICNIDSPSIPVLSLLDMLYQEEYQPVERVVNHPCDALE